MTKKNIIQTLFENEQLLAVSKPIQIHSTDLYSQDLKPHSIVQNIINQYPDLKTEFSSSEDYGLLHRLDFETSGLLLFAKNQKIYNELKACWKSQKIKKTYRALVSKNATLPTLPFTLTHPITQRYKNSKKVMVFEEKMKNLKLKTQNAHTVLLKSHPHPSATDLEIQIITGVRHQIRAHLSYLKAPILGDPLYGGEKARRLFLHSWKIKISPLQLELECPLPEEWF